MTECNENIMAWPEIPAPPGIDCTQFGLSGHGRLIWGEGNPLGSLLFVLDNPGAREDVAGTPFVCGTRQTLRTAIFAAGLDENEIYLTFLVKCRPRRAYDRIKARTVGHRILAGQIAAHKPKGLILFGDVVTKTLFQSDTVSVRTLRTVPQHIQDVPTVVTYHPLAARRRPNLYSLLVQDLTLARDVTVSPSLNT